MLWITLAVAASAAMPSTALVGDFEKFCGRSGGSMRTILAQADRDGWQKGGPNVPKDFDAASQRLKNSDQGLLTLSVKDTENAGERLETCGLSISSPTPDVVAATQALLGFEPTLNMGTSANFFAVRNGGIWRAAKSLSQADFAAAKAEGRYYSIVASTGEAFSTVYAQHVMPIINFEAH